VPPEEHDRIGTVAELVASEGVPINRTRVVVAQDQHSSLNPVRS
jgi:hypothetical protein